MTIFEERLNRYITPFEQKLPAYLPPDGLLQKDVVDAMAYSLLSGGKRIRAVLVTACYNLFESDFEPVMPFAAAIEMVHAYSLIHDDLPCMDDDDMRRGKPSCHIAFGESTALLAGDGLLTLAFETIARPENAAAFGCEKTLNAVRILSKAAGAEGMVGGQVIDLANEKHGGITLERLALTDSKKTGALIMAACETGCVLGGADDKTVEKVLEFAGKIGLAFQIRDDVLDVKGDPAMLGKPVGSDSGNNKQTYVSFYGAGQAEETARRLTDEAITALKSTDLETEFLCSLARSLAGRQN